MFPNSLQSIPPIQAQSQALHHLQPLSGPRTSKMGGCAIILSMLFNFAILSIRGFGFMLLPGGARLNFTPSRLPAQIRKILKGLPQPFFYVMEIVNK